MKLTDRNIITIFIGSFTIVGALLRFYNLGDWSLTNDELSVLNRTQHATNIELWLSYASFPDTHPPLAQFLIYNWIHLFGNSPFLLRLPFVIMGILSIPISYRLVNRWFSPTTGIFVAGSVALLNYPIIYSQLARPYGIGLFFGLLFAYYWTKLIISGRYTIKTYILYVFFGICSLYIHYFLSLSVGIIMLTGLFMIKKHRVKVYLILNTLVLAGFLPFFKYFLIQLKEGGVGGWLPAPENDFYLMYLFYAFNNSWVNLLLIAFIIAYGIRNKVKLKRRNWIMLIWGTISFIIGFLYSRYSNPVIQFSTLLFSFPFLLAFLFSFTESLQLNRNTNRLILLYAVILFFTSAVSWRYYHTSYFGEFKETSKTLSDWTTEMDESHFVIGNMVAPFYYEYYLEQFNWNDSFLITSISNNQDLSNLSEQLKNGNKNKLVFSWSNINNPFELKELIRYHYPSIEKKKRLNNAEVIVYGKGAKSASLFSYQTNFDKSINELGYSPEHVFLDTLNSNFYFQVPEENEYPLVVKDILGKDLFLDSADVVTFMIHFKAEKAPNSIIAISIDNEEGNISWRGTDLSSYHQKDEWNMALVSLYLPNGISPTDKIKAYVWNREKETFLIDDVSFFAYKDSHYYLK